jgi:hypothetical protein
MQSRKKIERFIANVEVGTDPGRDREVLDEVVQRHIDFKQRRSQRGHPHKWRIAMKCRSTKVAALLVVAIVLAGTFGMGGGSAAFSQIRHGVDSTLAWLRQMVVGRTPGEPAVEPPVFQPTGEQAPSREVIYAARFFPVHDNETGIWQSLTDQGIELVQVSTDPEVYFTTLARAQAESFDEVVTLRTLSSPRFTVLAGETASIAVTKADPQNGQRGFALGLLPLVSSDGREVQSTISFHDGDRGFEIPNVSTEPGGVVLIRVKGVHLSEEAESEGPLEFLIRIQVNLP